MTVSANTQAILLLTGPLIAGRSGSSSSELLTHGEFGRLARQLCDDGHEPGDLLQPGSHELASKYLATFGSERVKRLLARGFQLSQAIERWQSRAIWVISRADADYPKRLKMRLKDAAPAILYGCGDNKILETGGLAIVGSRHVDEALVEYTESIGRLSASAHLTVLSGGARGIDQAAMRGALQAGGHVVGILSDSLERVALVREHREFLMEGRLVLISPYDPAAGFDVGHAMHRNKLIYGLADAALVVSSDYQTGGTWAGATEQLEKLHFVPVYIRSNGSAGKGLEALRKKGALPWPNPETPEALLSGLRVDDNLVKRTFNFKQEELPLNIREEPVAKYESESVPVSGEQVSILQPAAPMAAPADELFAKVKQLLLRMNAPKSVSEVAAELQISKGQAKDWLQRLVKEGVLDTKQKPLRYFVSSVKQEGLFGSQDQRK